MEALRLAQDFCCDYHMLGNFHIEMFCKLYNVEWFIKLLFVNYLNNGVEYSEIFSKYYL